MGSLSSAAVFAGGVLAGVLVCGFYILSLRGTIKLLKFYIHERIGLPRPRGSLQPAAGAIMVNTKSQSVDWEALLAGIFSAKTLSLEYSANRNIFGQGDPADSVFYLRRDKKWDPDRPSR